MSLKQCPIIGWKNLGEPPVILEEHGGYDVCCPACFLHTGIYPTKEEAEARWNELAAEEVHLDTYNAWPFEQKFPDHIPGNTKVLKDGVNK